MINLSPEEVGSFLFPILDTFQTFFHPFSFQLSEK